MEKCRREIFQLSYFFFIDLWFIFRVSVSNVHEREIRKFRFNISYLPSQQSGQVRLKSWFIVTMEADNKLLNYLPQQIFKGQNFARLLQFQKFSFARGTLYSIAKGWYQVEVSWTGRILYFKAISFALVCETTTSWVGWSLITDQLKILVYICNTWKMPCNYSKQCPHNEDAPQPGLLKKWNL